MFIADYNNKINAEDQRKTKPIYPNCSIRIITEKNSDKSFILYIRFYCLLHNFPPTTVWSEGFLYKVALPKLKIQPIMYFVIHNSVVLSKILKIIAPFWSLFAYYQNNQFYRVKISFFQNFALMAQWFSIFWITPLNCGWQNT